MFICISYDLSVCVYRMKQHFKHIILHQHGFEQLSKLDLQFIHWPGNHWFKLSFLDHPVN